MSTLAVAALVGCGASTPTASPLDSASAPPDVSSPPRDDDPRPSRPPSVADASFLEQFAATYRFQQGHPGGFRITPEGDAVLFSRSGPRSFVNDLWILDVATGQERVLLTAAQILEGAEEQLSAEERARRERMRLASRGITGFDLSHDGRTLLVPLSGRLFLVDRARAGTEGAVRELESHAGFPIDPRFSPDGSRIAVVREGDLWVIQVATGRERRLTTRRTPHVEHGAAEFVAQEEMGRFEGYWWSPDGDALLVQETDTGAVEQLHILDPLHPEQAPESRAYPRPGMANAVVRLALVQVTGGPARPIEWDRERYPYLATVRWSEGAPITLLVQDRTQQEEVLLAVDPSTLDTTPLLTERDAAWINLDQDMPRWLPGGERFLWTSERAGAVQLEVRARDGTLERTLTPLDAGYRSLVALDATHAWITASAEPTETHVMRVPLDGSAPPAPLTSEPGVHSAVVSQDGTLWVHTARSLAAARRSVVRRVDGTEVATVAEVAEEPPFESSITIEQVGQRAFRAAIVRPRNLAQGVRYPVLVHVYGGPGVNQVTRERDRWLIDQWYADHGFIVVSFDGRGTPGRGRAWERAIRGDFLTIPLEDQVAALQACMAAHPEMDPARVGIFGWSFGGTFSAMAALRRPDVFHAAIAGAPVSEWRDYDTHYTERYLGLPEPEGDEGPYQRSSVLTYAASADGQARPLLIVHGTADDNVYFSHAIKLSDALFRAGRGFEMLPLAGLTHMVPDPVITRRLQERIVGFFERSLAAHDDGLDRAP